MRSSQMKKNPLQIDRLLFCYCAVQKVLLRMAGQQLKSCLIHMSLIDFKTDQK